MKLEITSATRDPMTREWDVEVRINGKPYQYTVSDYDYNRAICEYRHNNLGGALNILKGVK